MARVEATADIEGSGQSTGFQTASFPISLRLIAAFGLAFAAASWLEHAVAQAVLPALRAWLGLIDPNFHTVDLMLGREGLDETLQWVVTVSRRFEIAGQVIVPDPRGLAQSSVRAAFLLQPAAIALALVAAWPIRAMREGLRRLLWLLPTLAVIALLDTPLLLAAGVWGLAVQQFDPEGSYPLLMWTGFLQAGGRQFLGFAAGGLSIYAAGARAVPFLQMGQRVLGHLRPRKALPDDR